MSYTETGPLAGFEDASCHIVSFPMERVTCPRTGGANSQLETKARGSCGLQGTECRQQPGELRSGSFPRRASRCDLAEKSHVWTPDPQKLDRGREKERNIDEGGTSIGDHAPKAGQVP